MSKEHDLHADVHGLSQHKPGTKFVNSYLLHGCNVMLSEATLLDGSKRFYASVRAAIKTECNAVVTVIPSDGWTNRLDATTWAAAMVQWCQSLPDRIPY